MGVRARCKNRSELEDKLVEDQSALRVPSGVRDRKVKRKKKRRSPVPQCRQGVNGDEVAQPQERQERQPWPFTPDEADHCESPLPIVTCVLSSILGKGVDELKVYDPYCCTGRVKAWGCPGCTTSVRTFTRPQMRTSFQNLTFL